MTRPAYAASEVSTGTDVPPEWLFQTIAHSADTVLDNAGHAIRHGLAVRESADQAGREFNGRHLLHHVTAAHDSQCGTIPDLAAWNRDVGAELETLDDATSLAGRAIPAPDDDVPPDARPATVAHLAGTVLVALGHARVHSVCAQKAPDQKSRLFHVDHALSHLGEALEHQRKYISALAAYFPDVAAELDALEKVTSLGSRAPVDTARSYQLADFRLHDRCDYCGDPKAPGRACDNPLCAKSAETDRGRARAELAAELAAAAGSRWEGPIS